jgi:hypothetical protein
VEGACGETICGLREAVSWLFKEKVSNLSGYYSSKCWNLLFLEVVNGYIRFNRPSRTILLECSDLCQSSGRSFITLM